MLKTEMRNPDSTHIDEMQTEEMVALITREYYNAVSAVELQNKEISAAIDMIANTFANGGRLFFIGAGTSGRLGVLDAAECPPTFGVDNNMVTGIMAGGQKCMFCAGENAEDNADDGRQDLLSAGVTDGDSVVGISASGGAAYVAEALHTAKEMGAKTIALTCNQNCLIGKISDVCICTDTGEEVITGSTRMKAGSAHKMVLNMLTTCAMVKIGKVYENMMINLKPANKKLSARMVNIVQEICGCDESHAKVLLQNNSWDIRVAINAETKHKV